MTQPSPQASLLSGDQRRAVERARDFMRAAAAGPRTLAAHLDAGAVEDTALFYATDRFGAAIVQLGTCSPSSTSWPPRSQPLARREARDDGAA